MNPLEKHKVEVKDMPVRLLDFCIKNIKLIGTRAGLKKAIKREEIKLNGNSTESGVWLKEGDIIEIFEAKVSNHKVFPQALEVIFEDDIIAIINKPAGIEVSGNKFKTIQNALLHNLKPSSKEDSLSRPVPVHRLDYSTSGLLICAKTHWAAVDLGKQFEGKIVQKTYHAIVNGEPPKKGIVDTKIQNKEAFSSYITLKTVNSLVAGKISLLKLFPTTGRKHQLRIHLSSIGHPIAGDKEYAGNFPLLKGKGMFLSATSIKFLHPDKQTIMSFELDIPYKFKSLLKREEERFKKLG